MPQLYRVELEDVNKDSIIEYEMAGSSTEALELVLGRYGMDISVKRMPFHPSQMELLDQARCASQS